VKAEIEQFKANYLRFSQHKKLGTGQALEPPHWPAWPQGVNSDETFRKLVSEAYKLWREQWGTDIGFLLKKGRQSRQAYNFGRLLNELRTAHQHASKQSRPPSSGLDKFAVATPQPHHKTGRSAGTS